MGCGDACPVYPGKRYLDWDLADPAGKSVEEVRPIVDEIERRGPSNFSCAEHRHRCAKASALTHDRGLLARAAHPLLRRVTLGPASTATGPSPSSLKPTEGETPCDSPAYSLSSWVVSRWWPILPWRQRQRHDRGSTGTPLGPSGSTWSSTPSPRRERGRRGDIRFMFSNTGMVAHDALLGRQTRGSAPRPACARRAMMCSATARGPRTGMIVDPGGESSSPKPSPRPGCPRPAAVRPADPRAA